MTAPKAKHRVPDVVKMAREYCKQPGNEAGGNLHIVLHDNNISDGSIQYCIEASKLAGDKDGAGLARRLLECSKSQRRRIVREAM